MFDIFDVDIDAIIRKAVDLRRELATEIDENDPARNSAAKRRQLAELHRVTADLRTDRRRRHRRRAAARRQAGQGARRGLREPAHRRQGRVSRRRRTGLERTSTRSSTGPHADRADRLRAVAAAALGASRSRRVVERGGFDAIIGNPPFLGGKKLTGCAGHRTSATGSSTCSRTARRKRRPGGLLLPASAVLAVRTAEPFGLIATNTIAQGDTREVGLDRMVEIGFTITRAIQSRSWPVASANLEYAAVWGSGRHLGDDASRVSDDVRVKRITTLLEPTGQWRAAAATVGNSE